ncbi:alkane 1-monooxygenase [Aquabacterium sp. A7-Y]|uniref:alkane 1-monooxygenase n=1 Tax=Aquabacterium sp. A7-Y TaxID=1349605 RepID=UPI00223CE3F0|nr:alkane 1-monooxygenase [Aquabacterium sp. A7-Y]MCW7540833.1 alkane 1-monooxygenase [Aquabacterium sp. A7-Y]
MWSGHRTLRGGMHTPPPAEPYGHRRFAFLWFLLAALPPFIAWAAASRWGHWDAWAWYTPSQFFILFPLIDTLVGRDRRNPDPAREAELERDRYYPALTLLCVPLQLGAMLWGAWAYTQAPFGPLGQLGWLVSMGCLGGVLAINTAHELIHKPSRVEQTAGGLLLASVLYGSFKVEHIYGHHVDVATPADGSTARRGETVYGFIARALRRNVGRAFELERHHTSRRGRPWRVWRSEVLGWFAVSAGLAAACMLLAGGWQGLIYFAGQAFFAICLLEVINYIEHYGLQRRQLADGRWERVDPRHSWNSDFLFSNLMLFQLQRHSDHHAHAARRYQVLRRFDTSPQLPCGYACAVVMALLPPLWRHVMDPRVDAHDRVMERAPA